MIKLDIPCRYLEHEVKTLKSKAGNDYDRESVSVFLDNVGRVEFAMSNLAFTPEIFQSLDNLKAETDIVLHCVIEQGQYKAPMLIAKDYDIE